MSTVITKKCLPRRTFLRSAAATLALPFLDGMVPALVAASKTAAKPVRRMGAFYLPNGMGGPKLQNWTPTAEGTAFEFTPILQPLAPFRDRMLVLSGLSNKSANPREGEGAGDHPRAQATFLTATHALKTEGADFQVGVSVDQIIARELGNETQLASLELALETSEFVGSCDPGYSCAYKATIAWRTPTTPLPMETDPRAVFERMFGASGSTDPRLRQAQRAKDRSILDSLTDRVAVLRGQLGATDRRKLTEYLEAVRDIERRIQRAEEQNRQDLPTIQQPVGVPAVFEEHIALLFDLLALAYQSDLTRVFTFMMAKEGSNRTFPQIGVAEGHHNMSHHQYQADKIAKVTKINAYYMTLFASFLETLRSMPEGDGTILDNSMIIYGSGISDGDRHDHENLPVLLVGGGAGQIKGGRHLRYAPDTPLANLHLTVLDKMGIPTEHFGDSTGRLVELSGGIGTLSGI